MFANAVMFNPGEEDVVQDAREMFESAVVSVGNFRAAEKGAENRRTRGESEMEEAGTGTGAEEDDHEDSVTATPDVHEDEYIGTTTRRGKRRRLG